MSKLFRLLTCSTLLLLLPLAVCAQEKAGGSTPDWKLIDENPGTTFSYDTTGIVRVEKVMVRVPVRVVYSLQGKKDALEILNYPAGFSSLAETRYLYELDCKKRKMHLLSVAHLESDGKVIKSADLSADSGWEEIPLYSRFDVLADEVCKP